MNKLGSILASAVAGLAGLVGIDLGRAEGTMVHPASMYGHNQAARRQQEAQRTRDNRRSRMAVRRSKILFPVATNYITPVNVEACTVRRKGKVIKGETDALLLAAYKERREMVNAAKRERRARRAA